MPTPWWLHPTWRAWSVSASCSVPVVPSAPLSFLFFLFRQLPFPNLFRVLAPGDFSIRGWHATLPFLRNPFLRGRRCFPLLPFELHFGGISQRRRTVSPENPYFLRGGVGFQPLLDFHRGFQSTLVWITLRAKPRLSIFSLLIKVPKELAPGPAWHTTLAELSSSQPRLRMGRERHHSERGVYCDPTFSLG